MRPRPRVRARAGALSLYGLTVEAHTPLGHWTARGEVTPVDEDRYAAEFLRPHRRARGRATSTTRSPTPPGPVIGPGTTSAYWRRAPFIGLGPSAHSGFGRQRRWNLREWAAYERAAGAEQSPPLAGRELLDEPAVRLEELYSGLRTTEGGLAERVPEASARHWAHSGLGRLRSGRVRLTPEGWLRLDALVAGCAAV